MRWRTAEALLTLREEINIKFPQRSKAADGTIGDLKHASSNSDHNPWVKDSNGTGVVTALDITNDPENGLDSEKLAEALLDSRDPRIKYVISNRKIAAGADGPIPWNWRKYNGKNAHNHHVHLSVEDSALLYDSQKLWGLNIGVPPGLPTVNTVVKLPVLRRRSKNTNGVKVLQEALNAHGSTLKVDGDFGAATDRAVRLFQKTNGLDPDGVVGPYTWELLI